ncbi:EVI2A protein, partial [Neodrepanis coruscans]|nr:EVI2A protein [Neodrepanis coruscans]
MKTKRGSAPHLALPAMIIFSLCLHTSANHTTYPWVREEPWNPISTNLTGSQNTTEANTNSPLSINFSSNTTTFEMQSTLQPSSSTMVQIPTSPPDTSAVPGTGGPRNTSKPNRPTTKETCEDNKSLIVTCFIIIAVLVLICTFLFLSTVITANKLSYLKNAQQGKRRPRSNGDIVATNSLWPVAAGTWQRMPKDSTGKELIMQDMVSGRDTTNQRKTQDETEKLTKATENEQENREPSQSSKPILTNFVVEI